MKKLLLVAANILLVYIGMAQDPAVGGIGARAPQSPRINEYTRLEVDFLNGSSTAFSPSTRVQWIINLPPTIEYDGNYSFDDPSYASIVNVTYTPYDAADGQIIYITSKPGVAFPGGGGTTLIPWIKGKRSGTLSITNQAISNPLVGTNAPGNDNTASPITVLATILPVTLTHFAAQKTPDQKSSLLSWTTIKEISTDRYEIERSADGFSFTKLGTVKATGNAGGEQQYTFTDAAVLNGKNFYRLKLIDVDGKSTYSGVQLLNFGKIVSIFIYPNPVKDKAFVTGLEADMTVSVVNEKGQVVSRQKATGNTLSVQMTMLPADSYHIQVLAKDGSIASTTKVVKE